MRRYSLPTMGLLALLASPLRAQDSASVVKTINDLEIQWAASWDAKNVDAVATFLAPSYIYTGADGERRDRTEYLAVLRASEEKWVTIPGPYRILVSGGTAVHYGEATYSVTNKAGKVSRFRQVWTDTWLRQVNGQWLCVATQVADQPLN